MSSLLTYTIAGRTLRTLVNGVCLAAALFAGPSLAEAAESEPVPVGERMRALLERDWLERDLAFAASTASKTPSPGMNASGVTTAQDASGGCDGIKNGKWGFHTASGERDPWWQVDLGTTFKLDRVVIFNRTDLGTAPRTRNIRILVCNVDGTPRDFHLVYQHSGDVFYGVEKNAPLVVNFRDKNVRARIVRLQIPGRCSFALDEVEVYSTDDPERNVALGRPADQKSVGPHSFRGTMGEVSRVNRTMMDSGGGFMLAHTKEVVQRGKELARRLSRKSPPDRFQSLLTNLQQLEQRLADMEKSGEADEVVRRRIYFEARSLVREIAFCNPLLDFDRLLFIKRRKPGGVFHMCDQYYGFNAVPGGGLFMLADPFGPNPKLVDLLSHSVVERGRLAGRKLNEGSFLSPELSFDGKTILFAYSEASGRDLEWSPTSCYHVFRVNADGTGLVQLTDGPWDDFDPCFLPGGRVAFVSERRGGYLRCGRHCPTYTLHSMAPDGSDIMPLSIHETHEWHPSVGNDGMIVYTRWDYVDRDTNVAHHIWTCYPDGRDPRSFHGNYPEKRESRPWMEMSIRAIPGSHRFVATAAAHHGHAFGSLVLIDPRAVDDDAMSQLERLTPEVPFPEAEGRSGGIQRFMVYATPWPLSEDDFLCVYDAGACNHGIYWIDRFGNRELIYRDPDIACLSPIPLRPRPMPPVIPTQTAAAGEAGNGNDATIAVMNMYDSDFEWPAGVRIAALRIVQLLPKTTPPPNRPRIGIGEQTNARAVLGTVPVEKDGSAYFHAPAGKLVYFQALDGRGMAVQSMRSATYVQPGERLACQGCHEHKHRAVPRAGGVPLALRRAPSRISLDVVGSNPFNYPRLVQPVLDRNCVQCHRDKNALDLSGTITGRHGWTTSYNNLASKYGFYFHVRNGSIRSGIHGGSRSTPGGFGARASALLEYMDERHYGVRLSEEDYHRLVLWLDCNSEFFGSYEDTEAQSRGEVVQPTLE